MRHVDADARVVHRAARRRTRATPIVSRPYPFFLAYALEDELEALGDAGEWQAEWKWDGIRAQLIRRDGQTFIWSRGEELVTDRFPELAAAAEFCPTARCSTARSCRGRTARRCRSRSCSAASAARRSAPKILAEVPVVLIAYDLLELDGARPARRSRSSSGARELETLHRATRAPDGVRAVAGRGARRRGTTRARRTARAREMRAEGLMLKRRDARVRRRPAQGRLVEVEGGAVHASTR